MWLMGFCSADIVALPCRGSGHYVWVTSSVVTSRLQGQRRSSLLFDVVDVSGQSGIYLSLGAKLTHHHIIDCKL